MKLSDDIREFASMFLPPLLYLSYLFVKINHHLILKFKD